ncbi:hypothetical protein HAX54_024270, partial [Datura stramonium]|nr:hypothetical protein [Datura stramonium]
MSCSFMNISFGPKALPSLPLLHGKVQKSLIPQKASKGTNLKAIESFASSKSSVAIQVGTLLAAVGAEPALAVTGVNNEEDLIWVLIQLAISAFFYFLVCP